MKRKDYQSIYEKIEKYQNLLGAVVIAISIIIAGYLMSTSIQNGLWRIANSVGSAGSEIRTGFSEMND